MNESEPLKERIEWILNGHLKFKDPLTNEVLFYFFFLEYCREKYKLTEEEFDKKYKSFLIQKRLKKGEYLHTSVENQKLPKNIGNIQCLQILRDFFEKIEKENNTIDDKKKSSLLLKKKLTRRLSKGRIHEN